MAAQAARRATSFGCFMRKRSRQRSPDGLSMKITANSATITRNTISATGMELPSPLTEASQAEKTA